MKKDLWKKGKGKTLLLVALLALAVALAGCEGDDGSQGPQGPAGPPGGAVVDASTASATTLAEIDVQSEITSVTIASPPVVKFTLKDSNGRGITGLAALNASNPGFVRFNLAKLVPGTNGDPDSWVSYVRDSAGLPTTERTGTLVDHGDGSYTYTFATDVNAVAGVTYQPTLTHRLGGQIGSGSVALEAQNFAYDFVPAGGAVTVKRNIATVSSCNECHGRLVFHGRRFEVEYCVTCHNPDLIEGPDSLNMSTLAHKIHSANSTYLDSEFAEVTFPQDKNCLKCHNGADSATPQGDNWKNKPNLAACGGCHDADNVPPVDFTTGVGHDGGIQLDNSACAGCHSATAIEGYHLSANATPNNPNVPAGAVNFTYEISGVTVNADNQAVINFRILADGTPVTFGAAGTTLLTGFTGSPSFLVAYALPQDGIATPADYNNIGKAGAQPASVSITNLWNGTQGTLTGTGGNYTATLTSAASLFPVGASLRTVALQGYFTQDAGTNGIAAKTARHTIAAVKSVTGEERREVVDNEKCANCHEWFEGHGGNRVYTIAVCTLCHNPNLSSSGRAMNPALAASRASTGLPSAATVDLGTSDTSTWPEDSNNLKDMIHGIHSAQTLNDSGTITGPRDQDYEFVRGRNDGIYYNWSEVTFPGNLALCTTCHKDGTWELPLSSNALPTTVRTTGTVDGLDNSLFTDVVTARATVPNETDWVNSPTASSCYYCHTNTLAVAHMRQNGGVISVADPTAAEFTQRSTLNTVESCVICHGPGKQADVETVHQ
jgi:OmcA/MtrC family decaheme c-type cytochrome